MTWRATTIIGIVRAGRAAMAADGQVSFNDTIIKSTARKIRRLAEGTVLAGLSGNGADAFALLEKLEEHLEASRGSLMRAAVELAREWRQDKSMRELNAIIAAVDRERSLLITGGGEILEPSDGIVAAGSGHAYALAAARALSAHTRMTPASIARESIAIASEICIYTGGSIQLEEL
ncbi:ATP-dependent protease subunit HslV [Candidatus Fermentibacteria bacterium]|nr:ATP-dependent protease subunit HslV [Candidatus Fermentibacteria bacterium]